VQEFFHHSDHNPFYIYCLFLSAAGIICIGFGRRQTASRAVIAVVNPLDFYSNISYYKVIKLSKPAMGRIPLPVFLWAERRSHDITRLQTNYYPGANPENFN